MISEKKSIFRCIYVYIYDSENLIWIIKVIITKGIFLIYCIVI